MRPYGLSDGRHGYKYCRCRSCRYTRANDRGQDRARESRVVRRELEDAQEELNWAPYDRQFPCSRECCKTKEGAE